MRVAAYARVSVASEDSVSTAAQIEIIQKWAVMRGGEVVAEYVDEGLSGSKDIERPAYDRMVADMEAGLFDAIAVKSLDRLGRRLVAFVALAADAKRNDCQISVIEAGLDTSTSTGKMMLSMLSVFAEFEADQISARQTVSQAYRRNAGRQTTAPSLGFKNVKTADGTVKVLEPSEVETVRGMYADLVGGMSMRALAMKLNDAGVRSKKGARWTASQVSQVMRNPSLNGQTTVKGDVLRDDAGMPVINPEWQILSNAEWQRLHAVLDARSNLRIRSSDGPPLLLQGIARCGSCGKFLGKGHATRDGGQVPIYRCLGRVRGECDAPVSITASALDGAVADFFEGMRSMPVSEQRLEPDADAVARKAAYAREIDLLVQSMSSLPVEEIAAAAERLTGLRQTNDAIVVEHRPVLMPTGATVQEPWDENPRRVIDAWLDEVRVNPGRGRERIRFIVEDTDVTDLEYQTL